MGGIDLQISLKREAKYLCPDLSSIRSVLENFGASYVTTKKQTDHIFRIYDPRTETNSKRVKVRIENNLSHLIYIYDRQDTEVDVEFDYFEIHELFYKNIQKNVCSCYYILNNT